MTGKILFADNDVFFLNTRSEFLERAGYDVLKAPTLSEAEWLLKNANIHLAILDIRMQDDDDEHDKSGLVLAQQAAYRSIPKIILTDHAYYEAVREALREQPGRFKPAIDVIKKDAGPEALLAVMETAFEDHVRINWKLTIGWKDREAVSLVRLIEPDLADEHLLDRAAEFEDLLRRLFYEEEQIRIERLLWQRDRRVALVVFAFWERAKPEAFVVVCGQNALVNAEARRFEKFAPNAPGETGARLNSRVETTHFAAIAYAFAGNDLESVQTLGELYRFAPPKLLKDALTTLFQKTLREWHQDRPIRETNPLEHFYRQRLEQQADSFSSAHIDEAIQAIESEITTRGIRMDRAGGTVNFHFHRQSFSYADPLPLLAPPTGTSESTLMINVPGTLTGDNILVDEAGRTWLTDFADAGTAPLLWNFAAVEAIIRFDWVESTELLRRRELEQSLTNTDFARPDLRDLDARVRKSAQAVSVLRRLAARIVGQNSLDYHVGIYFQAARRLAGYRPGSWLTPGELTHLAHAWLAMAMIADKVLREQGRRSAGTTHQAAELHILDEKARIVVVGNQQVRLPPQPFRLLNYLYRRANQVCTKEELLEEALQGEYDEGYLHTLIGRIRKTVEEEIDRPRYLITEPNAGYRLVPRPGPG
ncbi:MAG TPA: DNA-binding response regulator [Anaerolineales bacterium]|nr:DNA-binding response regulator [Anaerolineales bacterium]